MSILFSSSRTKLSNVRFSAPELAPAGTVTWDPNYLSTDAVLSDGNLTLRSATGGWTMVRSTRSFPKSMKIYAEFDITGDNNNLRVGLNADSPQGVIMTGDLGVYLAPIINQVVCKDPDTGVKPLYGIIYGPQRAKGPDFFYIAWDGERFYFGRDGQWVNGNPATGTGGTKALIPGAEFFIAADFADAPPARLVANFGATPFRFTPPAGYTGWSA